MLKTKIKNTFLLWLSVILIMVAAQIAVFLMQKSEIVIIAETKAQPQVLGDITYIRGPAVQNDLNQTLQKTSLPDLKNVKATSYLVFDLESGQDFLQKNIEKKLSIASLTKLMTGLIAYEQSDLNQYITITQADNMEIKPSLGLKYSDKVKAIDVFNAMLIGSTNDGALALAHFASGSTVDFVKLMNQEAEKLGMENSRFSNPIGFDSNQNYSSANDLKKLVSVTENLAAFKVLGKRLSYEFSGSLNQTYRTEATNKLIASYPDLEAIKTGYTANARGVMATKLNAFNRQIIILVLDSPDRESDTLELRKAILENFSP